MKNLILFTAFLLLSLTSFSQSEKTLIKSYQVTSDKLYLNLMSEKTISTWDNNYIKLELYIKSDIPQSNLDKLTTMGKYNFESKSDNMVQIISLPKVESSYKNNPSTQVETFFIKVWIPSNVQIVDKIGVQL
jgi:hypothetical protein